MKDNEYVGEFVTVIKIITTSFVIGGLICFTLWLLNAGS